MQWNSVHLSKKNRSAIYALMGNDFQDTALSEKGKEQKQWSLSQETGIFTYPPTLFSLMANGFSFTHPTLRLFLIFSEFPFFPFNLLLVFISHHDSYQKSLNWDPCLPPPPKPHTLSTLQPKKSFKNATSHFLPFKLLCHPFDFRKKSKFDNLACKTLNDLVVLANHSSFISPHLPIICHQHMLYAPAREYFFQTLEPTYFLSEQAAKTTVYKESLEPWAPTITMIRHLVAPILQNWFPVHHLILFENIFIIHVTLYLPYCQRHIK